jgi:hypothetical protein
MKICGQVARVMTKVILRRSRAQVSSSQRNRDDALEVRHGQERQHLSHVELIAYLANITARTSQRV